jgi:hypothetical protein
MNADFRDNFKKGDIDPQANYVFILKYSGGKMERDAAGFMPRGGQFGFIFTKDFRSDSEILQTIAHELGHGRLLLKHTFDKDYGITQGITDNLMDYSGKTHIAKWQWDLLSDPGIAQGIFDGDEDGMSTVVGNKVWYTFHVQETIRLLRIIYNTKINCNLLKYNIPKRENIHIGNNSYSEILIEFINKEYELIRNENVVFYKNVKITTADTKQAILLYKFIMGEEQNIYGKYGEFVTINGEIVTFEKITNQIESIIHILLKNGNYNTLTYEQRTALMIPIIEWKLGYYYASSFIYFWYKGIDNTSESESERMIKVSDDIFQRLFTGSSFFREKLKEAENSVTAGLLYNVESTKMCLNNIKEAIQNGNEIDINLNNDYERANTTSSTYMSYFKSHSVSFKETAQISQNKIIEDDFAYAIGSFSFIINIKGRLKVLGKGSRGYIEGDGIYFRIWDSFDFVGNQSLGNWNGDVFNVVQPSLIITNAKVSNNDFRVIFEKITGNKTVGGNTPWDFNVVTKYVKMSEDILGIDYSIDFWEGIKTTIITK